MHSTQWQFYPKLNLCLEEECNMMTKGCLKLLRDIELNSKFTDHMYNLVIIILLYSHTCSPQDATILCAYTVSRCNILMQILSSRLKLSFVTTHSWFYSTHMITHPNSHQLVISHQFIPHPRYLHAPPCTSMNEQSHSLTHTHPLSATWPHHHLISITSSWHLH